MELLLERHHTPVLGLRGRVDITTPSTGPSSSCRVTMGTILISTTRNEELVMGMIKLGLPYRVGFAISTRCAWCPRWQ